MSPNSQHHPFSINVVYSDDLARTHRGAFEAAVNRWLKVVVGGGPPVVASGETINGLLIVAECKELNREGGLSANTDLDLSALRDNRAGPTAGLPGKATITLDATDMKALDDREAAADAAEKENIRGYRVDLVAHEIGHALGLSRVVWERKGLLDRTSDPHQPAFTGPAAKREFGLAFGVQSRPIPLETFGRNEQFIGHWRQAYFHSELMTFFLEDRPNRIGPVTVAALEDLGYKVDRAGAETKEIDLDGSVVAAPSPILGTARPTVLRSHRWLNCLVR
jgi:Leishmanolysin